jgi:hypothetical protein
LKFNIKTLDLCTGSILTTILYASLYLSSSFGLAF